MQLVLDTKGLTLRKKGKNFLVESEKSERVISPGKLSSIAITATVVIHSDAVVLAIKNQIPLLFFNYIGKAQARLWSPYFESIATLRRQQVHFCESTEATQWMIDLFSLKTEGQIANLHYLKARSTRFGANLDTAIQQIKKQSRAFEQYAGRLPEECRQQMMGTEGSIARTYWQALGSALPQKYAFKKRSRRPAEDHFNAALNYLYGMLYTVVEASLFAAGLDPHLGILHVDEHTKPTLSFDLIETFRPWVDQLLIVSILQNEMEKAFFSKNQFGYFLNKKGKAYFIPLFNDFIRKERKYFNQESTVKNHIYFLAAKLARRVRTLASG